MARLRVGPRACRAAATNARRSAAIPRVREGLLSGRPTRPVSGVPVGTRIDPATGARIDELAFPPARAPLRTAGKPARTSVRSADGESRSRLAGVNDFIRGRLRVLPASPDGSRSNHCGDRHTPNAVARDPVPGPRWAGWPVRGQGHAGPRLPTGGREGNCPEPSPRLERLHARGRKRIPVSQYQYNCYFLTPIQSHKKRYCAGISTNTSRNPLISRQMIRALSADARDRL